MYLADHTWPELRGVADERPVALLPIGSTEQHGPHLPESTDHRIAEAIARRAAKRSPSICLPVVPIGVSPHHKQFPGTVWVDAPAFRNFIESYAKNLSYHGFERIVFVNAHGGNVPHLREVGRRLYDAEIAFAIEWMWDESITELIHENFANPGPHAGPKETSMMLVIDPDSVNMDALDSAREDGIGQYRRKDYRRFGARVHYDAITNSQNGAFGDPTDATPEIGRQLLDGAVENLVQLVDWLTNRSQIELRPPDRIE